MAVAGDQVLCTPAEASRMWQVSPERARQLIFREQLVPVHVVDGGRRLVARADVARAAELAGPPGVLSRWAAVKAGLVSGDGVPAPWRPGRPSPRTQVIAALPWDRLVEEYQAGTASVAEIAARHRVGVRTVRRQLTAHGVDLSVRHGVPRVVLAVSDEELRLRYAAGATLAELAAEYRVSSSLVWRRIHFRETAPP